ncbi:MAG TPA: DUF4388 domain-containing protein [Polyangiaceae bacterium]|jgi:hypothetical protein|nr:DUF4388 domain-containing protein [Polyangiaceae bacterium]
MKYARDELVRIDERGEAHPIGPIASQRMRARTGAFRMLPSPQHVVFMRYTGEDGRRDDEDGAVVRLSGEITHPGAMCEILGLIAQTSWKGELCTFDGEDVRSLFFEQNNIVGIQTSCEQERLGTIMYRFGGIDEAQYNALIASMREGERIGKAAVEAGFVKQEQVFKYLRRQIEEVVHATLTLSDGTFFFLDGFEESRLVSRQILSANAVLMDGVTRLDEIRFFREKIPSAEHVPVHGPESTIPVAEEFRATFDAINGERSILEIGRLTGRGEFETTRDLYALLRTKQALLTPPRLTGGLTAIVAIANEALQQLHDFADVEGAGVQLREGLASFASGAGVYDMLFRRAGPANNGTLDPEIVAENLSLVAGDSPEFTLRQMLHEYVGFGLFCAGAALGAAKETDLKRQVGPCVSRLQPPG